MKSIKELLNGFYGRKQPILHEIKPDVFVYFNKVYVKPQVGDKYGLHEYPIVRVHDYGEGYYRIHTLDLDGKPTIDNIFYVFYGGN